MDDTAAAPTLTLPVTTKRIQTKDGKVFRVRGDLPPMTPFRNDEEREELVIKAISPWIDPDSGTEEYWVFAVGKPGSRFEQKRTATLTKIPREQVIREDNFFPVAAMEAWMAQVSEQQEALFRTEQQGTEAGPEPAKGVASGAEVVEHGESA